MDNVHAASIKLSLVDTSPRRPFRRPLLQAQHDGQVGHRSAAVACSSWRRSSTRAHQLLRARRIARAIVNARADAPITRTGQLADIVRNTYRGGSSSKIDPATKTFQAIRIQVNEELDELKSGLRGAEIMLAPSGRLAVVSFHSLEDRIVKEFLRTHSGEISRASRHLPAAIKIGPAPCFSLVRRGAQKPSAKETTRNPRSRSARLRVAERTCAPPMGET